MGKGEKTIDTWLEVQLLGSGYAAVQMVTVKLPSGETYPDVQQTGFGRYKTHDEAAKEMRQWSESYEIRIGHDTITIPAAVWGDTAPCLRIARHYGVDWGDVLVMADCMIALEPVRKQNVTHSAVEAAAERLHGQLGKRYGELVLAIQQVTLRTREQWKKGVVENGTR